MDEQVGIARNVHYVSHGTPIREDGTQAFASECRAAIITGVHADGYVDLFVMNPTGVFLNQGCRYEADKEGGTWHWPRACTASTPAS